MRFDSMKLKNSPKELAVITVGNIIVAAAVFFFMLPSHVSVGSASALAMVLSNFIPLSVSAIALIMNLGLLVVGFLLIIELILKNLVKILLYMVII